MIQLAITGGIGSGKTTVCKIFECLGISVYYSDDRAKYLMNKNTNLVEGIKSEFGNKAYKNESLDREYIASVVFNDKTKLRILNSLVHPIVAEDYEQWCERHKNETYLIHESAIVFEANIAHKFDKILTVSADVDIRIDRVVKRNGAKRKDISDRIENQITDVKREEMADYCIRNNNQALIPQILEIHNKLIGGK
ncbi:MAG: dephospho-CoA kinase [Marinifilaceae bacterium]|jgi:dephospho-CoA kinase|nr:dephospho-CoA kinase [Marinifilaceae bacterium]